MTQRLYRITVLMTALVWLQAGMRLSHVAMIRDARGTPEPSELLLLALLVIWGAAGVVVLWRQPGAGNRLESNVPDA